MTTSDFPDLLLVDDDVTLCSVLAPALGRRGFRVTSAHDYASAVLAAMSVHPPYAVIDLKFPGGTGLSLLQRLLQIDPGVRVVVLTGYASIATAIEAVKLHAHYYLTKPANADQIAAALRSEPMQGSAQMRERPLSVGRLEWEHIQHVLAGNGGNISATARVLGMHRRTLQRKLSKRPVRD
jgi:two-component system response regulator RegA